MQNIKIIPRQHDRKTVTGGLLFAYKELYDLSRIALFNDNGERVPAQFNVNATYPGGSIKAVQATALIGSHDEDIVYYQLDYGDHITPQAIKSNLSAYEDNEKGVISISTGEIKVNIDKMTGQFFESVSVRGRQVMGGSFSIWANNELDGITYNSEIDVPDVRILVNGPLWVRVEIKGYIRAIETGHKYTKYSVWLDFYNNSDEIDIQYTMTDDEPNQSAEHFRMFEDKVQFAKRFLDLDFDHELSGLLQCRIGGDGKYYTRELVTGEEQKLIQDGSWRVNTNGAISAINDAEQDDSSGHNQFYYGVGTGSRAKGNCTIFNGSEGFSVFVKDFWQRWPNALRVSDNKVTVSLHPEEIYNGQPARLRHEMQDGLLEPPNCLYHQRRGMAQTYNLKLKFHTSKPDHYVIDEITEQFNQDYISLQQLPIDHCESKALYELSISDGTPYNNSLLNNVLLHAKNKRPHRENLTGWRNYGDRYRSGWETTAPLKLTGFYNGAHVGAINYFILYFCTGHNQFLEQGIKETRHVMDIDISHAPTFGVKNKDYEPYPPGEIKSSNHKDIDHDCRHGHAGHYHLAGLVPYYYLTRNPRAKEVIYEAGQFIKHIAPMNYPLPRPAKYENRNRGYFETERDFGWPFYIAIEYVKAYNDRRYWEDTCHRMMQFMVEWWQAKGDHIQADKVVGRFDWEQGASYWQLDDMDNGVPGAKSNGCQPWMAGSMFHVAVEWVRLAEMYGTDLNIDLIKEMLYQCMSHVFKWGYDKEQKIFYYSEVRKSNGGETCLLSPFAQIMLWHHERHGEISALWRDTIEHFLDKYQNQPAKLNQFGFYGYELLFPHDFFKLAKRLLNTEDMPEVIPPELEPVEPVEPAEPLGIWDFEPPNRFIEVMPNERVDIVKRPQSRLTYWLNLDNLQGAQDVISANIVSKPDFVSDIELNLETGITVCTAIGFIINESDGGIYHIEIEYKLTNGDKDRILIDVGVA